MRYLFLLSLFFIPITAHADETQIITDSDKGTITFIIDNKPVAQINKDGFHVVESINYGGALTDTGSAHIEQIIQEGEKDAE